MIYGPLTQRQPRFGFAPWKTIGGYEGWYDDGASIDLVYTTPENAIRTANWIKKHGLKKASRRIVGDHTFGTDVRAQYPQLIEFVRALKAAARRAKKTPERDFVTFITQTGGYPWLGEPQLWTGTGPGISRG